MIDGFFGKLLESYYSHISEIQHDVTKNPKYIKRARTIAIIAALSLTGVGVPLYLYIDAKMEARERARSLERARTILSDALWNNSPNLMQRAIEISNHHSEIYCRIGDHFFKQDNHNKAREYYEVVAKKGDFSYADYLYGICCMVNAYSFTYRRANTKDHWFWGEQVVDEDVGTMVYYDYIITSTSWSQSWRELAQRHLEIAYANGYKVAPFLSFLEKDTPELLTNRDGRGRDIELAYGGTYDDFNIAIMSFRSHEKYGEW